MNTELFGTHFAEKKERMPDIHPNLLNPDQRFIPHHDDIRREQQRPTRGRRLGRREFVAALGLSASILLGRDYRATAAAAIKWDNIPTSPVVHADGKITFIFPAGNFRSVVLNFSNIGPVPLRQNATGAWQVTIGPFAPQIYSYDFSVDGVQVLDPLNPWVKKNLFFASNLVLIPGRPPEPWEETRVPHGAVTRHYYYSHIVGDNRSYYVYTPPGYHADRSTRYPTLYLLHGYSDTPNAWIQAGRANFILDNLIHTGRAKPMIIVMPNGYGDPAIVKRNGPGLSSASLWHRNLKMFEKSLLNEIAPRIATEYRVRQDRESRAIAGLSMGGGEALVTGLNHLDYFAFIGGLSAYLGNSGMNFRPFFPILSAADNKYIRLLWISCGRQDPLVGSTNRELDRWLDHLHIKYRAVWTPGVHQWRVWRDNLVHLAPLLFT